MEFIKKAFGILLLILTLKHGVLAIALGGVGQTVIAAIINTYPNKKLLGYNYFQQTSDLIPSIILSSIMGVIVWSMNYINIRLTILLLLQVIVGVIVYVLLVYVFQREMFNEIISLVKGKKELVYEKMNIPFSPPDISEAEINEVVSALRSGWITTGPRTKELERLTAEFVGTERAVCLNSQTACSEMTLHLLGVGPEDEVIVPAYTYSATASVVAHVGATIVMIDCQENSLEMDYEAMEKAITEKTKVIIPVDLAGIPCNYDKIFEIVEKKKGLFSPNNEIQKKFGRIIVLSDTAHAFGAYWKGKPVGSIADFSSFSFHAVKNFTTAEGGALSWRNIDGIDNEDIYKQLQLFSLHGQNKDALAKPNWKLEYDIRNLVQM